MYAYFWNYVTTMRVYLRPTFGQAYIQNVVEYVLVYVYFCFSVIITRVYLVMINRVRSCLCHSLLAQPAYVKVMASDRYKAQKSGAVRSCPCHFLLA